MKHYNIPRSKTRWLLAGDINHLDNHINPLPLLGIALLFTYALLGWAW